MKKILIALDTSPRAPHVLEQGVMLARAFGAKVVLLRAVGLPTELPSEALSMDTIGVTELLRDIAEKSLNRLAEAVPQALFEAAEVRTGAPWQVVCEMAEEYDVDLIVIGAHGHKFLDRVLGTTTTRVVSHTERSTFIVRGPFARSADKS